MQRNLRSLPNRLPSEALDRLVFRSGIDLHPELLDLYFGNYERFCICQVAEPELLVLHIMPLTGSDCRW